MDNSVRRPLPRRSLPRRPTFWAVICAVAGLVLIADVVVYREWFYRPEYGADIGSVPLMALGVLLVLAAATIWIVAKVRARRHVATHPISRVDCIVPSAIAGGIAILTWTWEGAVVGVAVLALGAWGARRVPPAPRPQR